MWRIAGYLRRDESVVAMHANGVAELNILVILGRLFRLPIVLWSHSREISRWMRRLRPLWPHLLGDARSASVSPLGSAVVTEAGIARLDQVAIVPNPIDADDVVGDPDGHDGFVVGYFGSDARYKGFHLLPSIIRASADSGATWLIFADEHRGSDPRAWSELRALPRDKVRVVGKTDDVREAYARCDVVLCPSLQESFCRVAAEAMLNGLPVVATDLPPLQDLLGDEDAGLLFPAGDVHAAAKAIERLADDAELRSRLGRRGRTRASAFDPDRVTDQLIDLYGLAHLTPTTQEQP
jgi:glycosyltransferase involved in cell wall biosynthesis